ncbi:MULTISPECIES: GNAT family N-acetyltransferase [Halomonas]|uniref:GNAT family N-acetyltransferase n=1 Tax=Halomonas TaxID=2745 RepID=UPI001A8D3C0F|nr:MULTISPECIES: N-acetyltransferase [Halomonas]MBN8414468.1 GNAT family N-acetyltransferase [Halomonas litopenaei]MBY6209476.1 GNAT family N-acetyltransferase [Halomonas sp. DP3Y7-2]MBY6230568.1 GNAT family N-acetyltransferase [Halomonas sp. DP3Y7-1]MCA0918672.1 GNAT family N-acetyltransferase [Halomonas denitrificans]
MSVVLRPAVPADLDALESLERRGFSGDRFNRRQLRYLLTRARAITLLAVPAEAGDADGAVPPEGRLLGYGTLLLRKGSQTARLYSLCVAPEARGDGVGRALLLALQQQARASGCSGMSLEVRADNRVALGLYRRAGFRLDAWLDEYYEDGCAAWKMILTLGEPTGAPTQEGGAEGGPVVRQRTPRALAAASATDSATDSASVSSQEQTQDPTDPQHDAEEVGPRGASQAPLPVVD